MAQPLRWSLLLALIGAAAMGYWHTVVLLPRAQAERTEAGFGGGYWFGGDFYPLWLVSRECIAQHRDPYSREIAREIQIGVLGHPLDLTNPSGEPTTYPVFAYPAFAAFLALPLRSLPFSTARVIVAGVLPLLTAASVGLWLMALRFRMHGVLALIVVALTLSSYPALEGLFAGQPGLVVGLLLAASFAALERQKLLLAGFTLSLCSIKPQMAALAILFMIVWSSADKSRWRFIYGLTAGLLAWCGAAAVVWPRWLPAWIRLILRYPQRSAPPLTVQLFGLRAGTVLTALLLLAAMALAWRMRREDSGSFGFSLTISTLLTITVVTLLLGHSIYDHIVLLPAVLFLLQRWREQLAKRRVFPWLLSLAAGAILWQWVAAVGVSGVRLVFRSNGLANWMWSLPIRTAAAIPFVVLACLGFMAWDLDRSRASGIV